MNTFTIIKKSGENALSYKRTGLLILLFITFTIPASLFAAEVEVAGNNLSFPVIFAESIGLTGDEVNNNSGLRGTGTEQFLGAFAVIDGVNVYLQQDLLNTWQADWAYHVPVSGEPPEIEVDWIDWGDNLESTTWSETSFIRVETTLLVDVLKDEGEYPELEGYEMVFVSGLGIDEMWGTNTARYVADLATVFSSCARLTIDRIDAQNGDVIYTVLDTAVYESFGLTSEAIYSAECNVKGKIIYGYNWQLRNQAFPDGIDKFGWYRITFSFDDGWSNGGPTTSNNVKFTGNTQIVVPLPEPEGEVSISEEPSGYTPVIIPFNATPTEPINDTNLTYIEIYVEESAKGGGGGGGNGNGGNNSTTRPGHNGKNH